MSFKKSKNYNTGSKISSNYQEAILSINNNASDGKMFAGQNQATSSFSAEAVAKEIPTIIYEDSIEILSNYSNSSRNRRNAKLNSQRQRIGDDHQNEPIEVFSKAKKMKVYTYGDDGGDTVYQDEYR